MSEHVSNLVLDELAAGFEPPEAARAHVEGCPYCAGALDRLRVDRAQLMRSPRYEAMFDRLRGAAQPRSSRWRWIWVAAPLTAAAAGLIAAAVVPGTLAGRVPIDSAATRLKSGTSIRVLRLDDGASVSAAAPGDSVVLAVTTAGRPYVLVFGNDGASPPALIWPPEGTHSGRVEPAAEVKLTPGFEVTPGTVTLQALYSDVPIEADRARRALQDGAAPIEGAVWTQSVLTVRSGP